MNPGHTTTFLVLLFCTGCTSVHRQANTSPEDEFVVGPREYVMVQGANDRTWYSGHQLIGIARRYAEEQKLGFDFDGTEKTVWVKPRGRVRADVWFSSEMGKPVLHVAINKYGEVIRHDTGTAICGTVRK